MGDLGEQEPRQTKVLLQVQVQLTLLTIKILKV